MADNQSLFRAEIEKLHDEGISGREIARRLGIHHSTVQVHVGRLQRERAASNAPLTGVVPAGFHLSSIATTVDAAGLIRSQSYRAKSGEEGDVVPDSGTFPAPDGMYVRSVSTLVDGQTGAVKQQWVKADKVKEQQAQLLIDAVRAAFDDSAKVPEIAAPEILNADLLTVYPMGDPHLGMYAWAAETGTDFDLEIAERNLTAATVRLVMASPPSEEALIVNVGDFFHGDTSANRTLRSGHALDVDTRWAKVLRVGARTMRTCIDTALTRHKRVRVVNEIGNHDEHTSQAMTLALSMLYENNPRVSFDDSPAKFHYYVFGKNLIGVTHGDTVKPDALGGIMATDRPEDWGATKFRYWLTGHVHNRRVFELPGCLVESFRTLAGKDSWTAASGYRAGRDMQSIVLHREFGERERHHIDISALEAAA
jgi:hypothetical protein